MGVGVVELERLQLGPFGLDARLDRVILKADPGEIVLDRPTLLTFVLEARAAANHEQFFAKRRIALEVQPVLEQPGRGGPMRVLIGQLEIVDPSLFGMLPSQ